MSNVIEIEVDAERNCSWHFLPLGRTIRGRIDFTREVHAEAIKVGREDFPKGIPGERLTLDLLPDGAGEAVITDPIHQDEGIKKQLKRRNMELPKERESFSVTQELIPSWLYWIRRGVEAKVVKVLRGKIPEKIDGKIVKRFANPEQKDPNATRLDKLTALLFANLPPDKQKAAQAFLDGE